MNILYKLQIVKLEKQLKKTKGSIIMKFTELFNESKTNFNKIENILLKAEKSKDEITFLNNMIEILKATTNDDILNGVKLMILSADKNGKNDEIILNFRKLLSSYQNYRDVYGDFRK